MYTDGHKAVSIESRSPGNVGAGPGTGRNFVENVRTDIGQPSKQTVMLIMQRRGAIHYPCKIFEKTIN